MSSRANKKRVWRLKHMTNGEWLNMLVKMDASEHLEFSKWCYRYGLLDRYQYYLQAQTTGISI